ncbi:MAG: TlpA family protein disulfide reductase [Pirellulales bacterium]
MPAKRLCFSLQTCFLVLAISSATGWAAEVEPKKELSPADTEFIAINNEFYERLDAFWTKLREYTDRDAAIEFDQQHDPGRVYLPKLLEFEKQHTGTDAGLNALADVASYAARSGDPDTYRFTARREALQRMKPYEDRVLSIMFVEQLTSGAYDPQVLDYLRRLGESPTANSTLRAAARLEYAGKVLSLRASSRQSATRLQDFAAGMSTDYPDQIEDFRAYVKQLPPAADLDARAGEAIAMLEELASSGNSFQLPAFRVVDPEGRLIRVDAEKENKNPPLSTKAAALLFQERYLRTGQMAPNIKLELIDGGNWKLADQRGRVVVIQFSFTGCGPCAAMYPDMVEMKAALGDELSLLTIMRDETPEHALAAKQDGKITWDVGCDGIPGDICTAWAVDSFPTIYVIEQEGKIAAVNLRGKQLRWKVEQLLAADGN